MKAHTWRIGAHTSISKSLEHAATHAHDIGANTFQIFSASPRMWRASMPSALAVKALKDARNRLGLYPLVIHDNYLINMAAADDAIRALSVQAFRGELERGAVIGAEYLVAHPGSFKGHTLEAGILRLVESLVIASTGLPAGGPMLLLENTAGQGSTIGRCLEELATIRTLAAGKVNFEIGYCLDTCHLLASGYDITTKAGLENLVRQAEAVLPLDAVRVIHCNDSKTPLGSNVDRHQHIGKGYIGEEAFHRILTHPRFRNKAFILETPEDEGGDHERNIATLKRLCQKSRTTTTKSS